MSPFFGIFLEKSMILNILIYLLSKSNFWVKNFICNLIYIKRRLLHFISKDPIPQAIPQRAIDDITMNVF